VLLLAGRFWNCTEARCNLLERVQGPLEQARHKPLSRIRPLSRNPAVFQGYRNLEPEPVCAPGQLPHCHQ